MPSWSEQSVAGQPKPRRARGLPSKARCIIQTGPRALELRELPLPASPYAALGGAIEAMYLNAAALTVAAGTSEIQRNIIAGRGLGLPRG